MPTFHPKDIALYTGGSWSHPPAESISGFCFDARQVQPGQCFVALSAGARDGHDFIQQAIKGGALAVIVEHLQPLSFPQLLVADSLVALGAIAAAIRAQFTKPVIGITGSCGKTSTKEMLRVLLGEHRTHATAGNWNNRIGVPMTLIDLNAATHDFAVIEAGINQPEEMSQLGQMIHANLNVLTNIGPAHLELLGSLENIAAEKSLLVQHAAMDSSIILPADALRYPAYAQVAERAIALLPEDEPAPELPTRELVHYAIETMTIDQMSVQQVQQQLFIGNQSYRIASPSRGIATNAALAIVAAQKLGVAVDDIRTRIQAWRPAGSRGRVETLGAQTFYIDCYNANPASMADALEAFVRSTPQDLARMYILGAMNELGDTAAEAHKAMGQLLQLRGQDRAVFIGPALLTQAYTLGATSTQCTCSENIEKIKSIVAQFSGAIFLKGSRSYQLEKLLPEAIR